jgi:Cu/Ag efflux protein CusF
MKKAIVIIVSVLFVFSITALTFAAEKSATPAPMEKKAEPVKMGKEAPVKVHHVAGEVVAADMKAKTITVKGNKGDVVIAVDDKVLAKVKAGDKVEAKYTEADGKNTAKSVKKATAKMAEKEKKEKAAPAPMESK